MADKKKFKVTIYNLTEDKLEQSYVCTGFFAYFNECPSEDRFASVALGHLAFAEIANCIEDLDKEGIIALTLSMNAMIKNRKDTGVDQ